MRAILRSPRVGLALLLGVACVGVACDQVADVAPRPGAGSESGFPGKRDAGSEAGSGGEPGAGGTTAAVDAGVEAGPVQPGCGDGVRDPWEACDGFDVGAATCASMGYESGQPSCTSACALDFGTCRGTEHCSDGIDNDGDQAVDCQDTECAMACADACAAPVALADGVLATGLTTGHAVLTEDPSCTSPGATSGPAVAYRYVPTTTGAVDVQLTTNQLLTVSLRTSCGQVASQFGCALDRLTAAVTAGSEYFIVVSGYDTLSQGTYQLLASSRTVGCGNGFLDPGEECDDYNLVDGDGCSATCQVESEETEPNDNLSQANPLAPALGDDRYFDATVRPELDKDTISVDVPSANTNLQVQTRGFYNACSIGAVDSFLEVLDASGTVLTSDDDSGDGLCAKAVAWGLAAGTYYVRVSAPTYGSTPTFAYRLQADLGVCGNGVLEGAEQCEYSGTPPSTCTADCRSVP